MYTNQVKVMQGCGIFREIAALSFEGLWYWNIKANEFFLGTGFRQRQANPDWRNLLHPGDRKAVETSLWIALASSVTDWEQAFRLVPADGSVTEVVNRARILRDTNGEPDYLVGIMLDKSKQRALEEKLEREMGASKKQVEEAKDSERLMMGKELHDNVNQLLGASKLYLDMAKRVGKNNAMYLSRSSEYILTAIEEIRKLTKGVTTDIIKNLGLCDAISNVIIDMMEVNPVKISADMGSFNENGMNEKFKLNIFRIVQEQLNNILKHARATKVTIRLSQNEQKITLAIADDGIGFDPATIQKGMGLANIEGRATAYNGNVDFNSQPGRGCVVTVTFPANGQEQWPPIA